MEAHQIKPVVKFEDTHPELAEFIQKVAHKKKPFGVYKIKDGKIFSEKGIRTIKKPGRNEPCPCGSGKKFKKCCGRLQ